MKKQQYSTEFKLEAVHLSYKRDYIKELANELRVQVKEEDFELMAENTIIDVCTGGNPRDVTVKDAIDISKAAM